MFVMAVLGLGAIMVILAHRRATEILWVTTLILFASATFNASIPFVESPALLPMRFGSAALLILTILARTPESAIPVRDLPRAVRLLLGSNLLLLVLAASSTVWSVDPGRTVQQVVAFGLLIMLMTVAVTRRWTSRSDWSRDLAVIGWTLTSILAAGLVAPWVGLANEDDYSGRYFGLMNNPNQVAMVAAVTVPLVLGRLLQSRRWWDLIPPFIATYTILIAGSRSSFLAAVIALAWYAARRGRGALLVALASLAGLGAVLSLIGVQSLGIAQTLIDRFSEDSLGSVGDRTAVWQETLTLWSERPILGYGFRSGEVVLAADQRFLFAVSHSSYLQMLLELGVLGAAVATVVLAASLRLVARKPMDSLEAGVNAAVVSGLAIGITESAMWGTGQLAAWVFWVLIAAAAAPLATCCTLPSSESTSTSRTPMVGRYSDRSSGK